MQFWSSSHNCPPPILHIPIMPVCIYTGKRESTVSHVLKKFEMRSLRYWLLNVVNSRALHTWATDSCGLANCFNSPLFLATERTESRARCWSTISTSPFAKCALSRPSNQISIAFICLSKEIALHMRVYYKISEIQWFLLIGILNCRKYMHTQFICYFCMLKFFSVKY